MTQEEWRRRVLAERLQDEWHEANYVRLQIEIARNLIERVQAKIKPLRGKVFPSEAAQFYTIQRVVEEAVREWRLYQSPFYLGFNNEEWFNVTLVRDLETKQPVMQFSPQLSAMLQGQLNLPILTGDAPIIKYMLGQPLENNDGATGTGVAHRQTDAERLASHVRRLGKD